MSNGGEGVSMVARDVAAFRIELPRRVVQVGVARKGWIRECWVKIICFKNLCPLCPTARASACGGTADEGGASVAWRD